jgi:hypothetical protein
MASFTNGLASIGTDPIYSTNTTQIQNPSAAITNGGVATPGPSNAMFGSPGALTSGAAGKTGITSGPQLTMGGKAGNNLSSTGSGLAPVASQLGGAK